MNAHDTLLLYMAESVDDLERLRIAAENRVRSAIQVNGMEGTPEVARMEALAAGILELEKRAIRDLERAMKAHPLGAHVKVTVGLGLKQTARLLAAIGDPAERPNPAKLWQFAGHGDPARSRLRKGCPAEFNPTAKMRTRLCAKSCIKHRHSPYREVYDRERAKWADRETSDGHKDSHALRVVGKAILRDLWVEARKVAQA